MESTVSQEDLGGKKIMKSKLLELELCPVEFQFRNAQNFFKEINR